MDKKKQKIIDTIQWILIIFLLFICGYIYFGNKNTNREDKVSKTEDTYIKIYESQKIKELEDENKKLYDSISKLENVESAIQIKYKYYYKTDTIFVKEFALNEDSIYHYENNNDTISTNIDIKANGLKWCNINSVINNEFTIITQEKYDDIITKINHSENTDIVNLDTWHRKRNWKDRLYYGPTFGVGYGMINNNIDVFVGLSIGYKF